MNKKDTKRFMKNFEWVIETDGADCDGDLDDCKICPVDCEGIDNEDHVKAVRKWIEDNK